MPIIRSNAIRIKRFRELREDLRTRRDRLLVGIDIAKPQHVAQVRLAHTPVLDKQLTLPNTQAGFATFWAHLQAHQRETGVPEIVCAVEPTGTYHEALAQWLEAHGVDVVLVANHVAHYNRRTLDGTWGKSDPKDAHNLCDLLERGMVLFYSLPDEQVTTLRRLVRLLRHARVELAACQARFRTTRLPAWGPAGAPLPPALGASRPATLQVLLPAAQRRTLPEGGATVPAARAVECTDLAARLVSGRPRIARIAAELGGVASPLPAHRLRLSLPGIGPPSPPSSSPNSGTSPGTARSAHSASSRGSISSGWRRASGSGGRGSPAAGVRSGAGRSTRRRWVRRARRSDAPGGPRGARRGPGPPTPSARRTSRGPRSSSGSSGGAGGAGAPMTRRGWS